MGFYVYVWHEPVPITADEARAKLERAFAEEEGIFAEHPAVSAFREALLDRYPALEDLSDEDIDTKGVWNFTPEPSNSALEIAMVWSRAEEVDAVIRELTAEHELVCFDPQAGAVDPNVPGYVPAFVLTTEAHPRVPDPSADRIERAVSKLSNDNYFAILERADGWYAQVGYGVTAAVTPGTYAMEYREASLERHFHAETPDRVAATRFLQEFLEGNETYKRRHAWRRLEL
jgi:hypothetical protein